MLVACGNESSLFQFSIVLLARYVSEGLIHRFHFLVIWSSGYVSVLF